MPVKAKKRKPAKKKKKAQRGGSGLVGFADFLAPELRATGWASQTAQNMSHLPFSPEWAKIMANVASQSLRHAGY